MIALVLSFFGYAKVPPEAVALIVATRRRWEKNPADTSVGEALVALEGLMRSARSAPSDGTAKP